MINHSSDLPMTDISPKRQELLKRMSEFQTVHKTDYSQFSDEQLESFIVKIEKAFEEAFAGN